MRSLCRTNVVVTNRIISCDIAKQTRSAAVAFACLMCLTCHPQLLAAVWLKMKKVTLVPRDPPMVLNVETKWRAHKNHAEMTLYFDSPGLANYTVIEHYLNLEPMRRIVGSTCKPLCKVVFDSRHYPELFAGEVDLIMYHQSASTGVFGLHRLVKIAAPRWAKPRRVVRKR